MDVKRIKVDSGRSGGYNFVIADSATNEHRTGDNFIYDITYGDESSTHYRDEIIAIRDALNEMLGETNTESSAPNKVTIEDGQIAVGGTTFEF